MTDNPKNTKLEQAYQLAKQAMETAKDARIAYDYDPTPSNEAAYTNDVRFAIRAIQCMVTVGESQMVEIMKKRLTHQPQAEA